MARPGYSRLLPLALLCLLAWIFLPVPWRGIVGGALFLLLIFGLNFYRDPERQGPPETRGGLLLSPADGRVVALAVISDRLHISVFLSPLDVHVNRAPVSGRVIKLKHTPGRFLPAYREEASAQNERVQLLIDSPEGEVSCTQVAGLVARRIENWIDEGQSLVRGQRYGMIHLGSRVDLDVPSRLVARVKLGDRVKAGVTVLAERTGG